MSVKIIIKNRNNQSKEYIVSQNVEEVFVERGDDIFVTQGINNIKLEIVNNDLKIIFTNNKIVLLKDFVKLLEENPIQDIAPQFNDLLLLNQLTTKIEFMKSSLFDVDCNIVKKDDLEHLMKNEKEEKVEQLSHKSIKFLANKQSNIKIEDEEFEYYLQDNFKVFIRN